MPGESKGSGMQTSVSDQELRVLLAGWLDSNSRVREDRFFDLLLDVHDLPENVPLTPRLSGDEARLADAWNINQCFIAAIRQFRQQWDIH